jgi:hypothetical protein
MIPVIYSFLVKIFGADVDPFLGSRMINKHLFAGAMLLTDACGCGCGCSLGAGTRACSKRIKYANLFLASLYLSHLLRFPSPFSVFLLLPVLTLVYVKELVLSFTLSSLCSFSNTMCVVDCQIVVAITCLVSSLCLCVCPPSSLFPS